MQIQSVQTSPPSPAAGDRYIIGPSADDTWSGKDRKIAIARSASGDWLYRTPATGETVFDAEGRQYVFDGTNWLQIISPLTLRFYATDATAVSAKKVGLDATTTSLAANTPESGYAYVFTGALYDFQLGASGGTYTLNFGPEASGTLLTAGSVTGTEGQTLKGTKRGSLVSPLITLLGATYPAAPMRVGWENAGSSPGALASGIHSVHLMGYLARVY